MYSDAIENPAPIPEEPEASSTETSQQSEESEIPECQSIAEEEAKLAQMKQEVEQQRADLETEKAALEEMKAELKRQSAELGQQRFAAEQKETVAQGLLTAAEQASKAASEREASISIREAEVSAREARLKAEEADFETRKNLEEKSAAQLIASQRATSEQEISAKKVQAETDLTKELSEKKRAAIEEISDTLSKMRTEGFRNLDAEIERERSSRLKNLEAELQKKRTDVESDLKAAQAQSEGTKKALDQREQELDQKDKALEEREQALAFNKARIDSRERQLTDQQDQINEIVDQAVAERQRTMDSQVASAQAESDRLRGLLKDAQNSLGMYRDFQEVWGNSPDVFHAQITGMQKSLDQQAKELAQRPPVSLVAEYEALKKEYDSLVSKNRELSAEKARFDVTERATSELRRESEGLQEQVKELEFEVKEYKGRCDELRRKLERYVHPENAPQLYDERVAEIKQPYLRDIPHQGDGISQPSDEIAWLGGIAKSCDDYGISFPKRILYAFHTSLKIADWSSITVLSGVSGTGKSELPRLYSIFGGVNFISVPVQPNWDSQESMLGYFNSIDNRFDAQPLLRFLVQCTNWERNVDVIKNEPGSGRLVPDVEPFPLGKYVAIVLLDEMNLAHVEHYFADFLSKLESRRGLAWGHEPEIEVKLGAGCEPYHLKLKRNVLFVGTMNQDETTKSLSDKVLDRGIVIHFPRPTTLNSRSKMGLLDKGKATTLLEYKTWSNWCKRETGFVTEALREEVQRYKHMVEDINDQLEMSGRAIGHRVWQSIEYYIANYPTVISNMVTEEGELPPALRAAMEDAFEDQIVQKVMPKLRGIETRGEGGRQLEAIKQILQDGGFDRLLEDYDNACSRGYGQFSWNSAHYLEKGDSTEVVQ